MTKQYPIIKIKDHLYMVDKGATILVEDFVLTPSQMLKVGSQIALEHYLHYLSLGSGEKWDKIIATTDTSLGLPLLPAIEEDLKFLQTLADSSFNEFRERNPIIPAKHILPFKTGYIKGYKAASKKKYTEEHIKKAIELAQTTENLESFGSTITFKYSHPEEIISQLTPTPIAVEVEMVDNGYPVDMEGLGGMELGECQWFEKWELKIVNNFVIVKKWIYDRE